MGKPRTGRKYYDTYICKEPVSKIYKELLKLNTRKTNNPILKWARDLKRDFVKEDIEMINKYMKKRLTSVVIEKIKMKRTRCHYPLEWLKIIFLN